MAPRLVPSLVALTLFAACEQGQTPEGPRLEVQVAPLTLAGIGFACYDLAVFNGLGQPVWSRGDFATSHPADSTTICSNTFGNGAGGAITYVGPCDASAPAHEVALVLDGLYAANGTALTDFANPCPASAPCTVPATCAPNADTPVVFNLTVLRDARQGFFDVVVNFDDIFCSAKVDCTHDEAGQRPIELLFDPDTGARTQTAVVAFACTAGPGVDDSTTLLMNDLRVQCEGPTTAPPAADTITSCDDASTMVIGYHELSSPSYAIAPLDWTRGADGHYTPALAPVTGYPTASGEVAVPLQILDQVGTSTRVTTALGVTMTLGPSAPATVQTAFFSRTNLGSWQIVSAIARHSDSPAPIAWPVPTWHEDYLLTRDSRDGSAPNPFVTFIPRTNYSSYLFGGPPVHLRRGSAYSGSCSPEIASSPRYILMSCERSPSPGQWDLLIWDITSTLTTPSGATGVGWDPFVLPLGPAQFSFAGGVTVTRIIGFESFNLVTGNFAGNDRVFASARLLLSNGDTVTQLVAFHRANGFWPLEHPPVPGLDQLPTTTLSPNTWDPARSTSLTHVVAVEPTSQNRDFVVGVGYFGDVRRPFAAAYARSTNTWSVMNTFETAPGVPVFDVSLDAGLFSDATSYHVAGSAAATAGGPLQPFVAPYQGLVTFLPIPSGWTLGEVVGLRGDTRPAAPVRRLAGSVVSPGGDRYAIEWRFAASGGALTLTSWAVTSPSDLVADGTANDGLVARPQRGAQLSPRFSPLADRCSALLERYDGGWLVSDPTLDQAPGLAAVVEATTVTPTTGGLSGVRIVRDPVENSSGPVSTSTWTRFVIDPSQAQSGNHWTATTPRPAGVPAFIRQVASYFGAETIACDGEPCNKLYWNTAIAFDPTARGCSLSFEATAAQTSSLVSGQVPAASSYPLLFGRVPLTTAPATGPGTLACTQHPFGSPELTALYKPQGVAFPFCHTLGPSQSPVASELPCGYTAATWDDLEDLPIDGF